MNASSSESDDLSEADERLRRLIAHWMSPCDASQLNEEQVEALLHEPFDCTLSDDQMELILRKATAKIHAGAPGAPACGSRVDETAGDLGPLVPPVADESLTPGSAPPSPVLGFLDGVANLGSFTPTFWTLLAMVSGIVLTLAFVVVLLVRGIHVQVDVPDGGRQLAGDTQVAPLGTSAPAAVSPAPFSSGAVAPYPRRWPLEQSRGSDPAGKQPLDGAEARSGGGRGRSRVPDRRGRGPPPDRPSWKSTRPTAFAS